MTILQAFIMGIIQGLTEFIPVSSSGHLVITPFLLGWQIPADQIMPFDVLVQWGTLLAAIIYFWKDLWSIVKAFFAAIANKKPFETIEARWGWYIILATIPAALAGVFLKDMVESVFQSVEATALFLFVTALLLIGAEWIGKRAKTMKEMNWKDALWIGIFQIISLLPGVSRSGATIAGGMARQLDRPSAARFSFLIMIPIMLGAGILSILDLFEMSNLASFLPVLLTGFIASLVSGYFVIHLLLNYLRKRSYVVFAVYCALIGLLTLVVCYVA